MAVLTRGLISDQVLMRPRSRQYQMSMGKFKRGGYPLLDEESDSLHIGVSWLLARSA